MSVQSNPFAADRTAVLETTAFRRIAALAEREAGLAIPEAKLSMVQSRLNRRLQATGLRGFDAYLQHVESCEGLQERAQMISALTTNVSQFFREDHHFKILRETLVPMIEDTGRRRRFRIWSAGCSTGEEPYSIAISLVEEIPGRMSHDIRILASDIDRKVLGSAIEGIYGSRDVVAFTKTQRSRFFARHEGAFRIREEIKKLVTFRRLNLVERWPMNGPFDIIFCRNVLIYFSEETQNMLWPRFADLLCPGGMLFLGHSERIPDPGNYGLQAAGVTTYVKCHSKT